MSARRLAVSSSCLRAAWSWLALMTLTPGAALAQSAPPPPPRITDPESRSTRSTAYALPRGTVSVSTSLLGVTTNELYGSLGVAFGLGAGVQLGANLAHLGAGLFNLGAKWQFLDQKLLSLSVAFSPAYAHGDWIWVAAAENLVAGFDVWAFPVELSASSRPNDWLELDLTAAYTDIEIVGDIDSDSLVLDAQLAQRQFHLRPRVWVHLLERSSLFAEATLPLFTSIPVAGEATVVVGDGVVVGGTSGGRRVLDLGETYVLSLGARSMINRHFYVDIQANFGPRIDRIYGTFLAPRVSFEARF